MKGGGKREIHHMASNPSKRSLMFFNGPRKRHVPTHTPERRRNFSIGINSALRLFDLSLVGMVYPLLI